MHVTVKRRNWHTIIQLAHKRCHRVIYKYTILYIPIQDSQVLNETFGPGDTAFSVQSMRNEVAFVNLINYGVSVVLLSSGENLITEIL